MLYIVGSSSKMSEDDHQSKKRKTSSTAYDALAEMTVIVCDTGK